MEKQGIITSVQDVKLPMSVKLGYGAGSIAKALLAVSMAAFLLFFYVDICGINAKVASTIILVAKIWDIINDPMMGAIVDKTVSKEGKCRFYLKYFSVPTGIIFALTFVMPGFAMPGKIAWAAVTYILQGMASTVLLIPLNTLMGRITANEQQRVQMSQIANICNIIGVMAVTGLTMRIVMAAGGENMVKGFAVVGVIYGVIYAICHLIVFFATKGYEPLEHLGESQQIQAETLEKVSLSKRLSALTQNGMWITIIIMFLIVNIAMAFENAALAFYIQYNHGNDMNLYSIFSVIGTVSTVAAVVLLNILTRKLGVIGTAAAGAVLGAIGYFLRFFAGDATTAIISAGWFITQLGCAMINCVILLLIFQSRDYGIKKTGVDNEAILMSGFSVSYKIGMAIGGAVLGYIMPAAYVAGAEAQSESVQNFFFQCSTLIPGICCILCIVFCIALYRFEKVLKED